MSTADLIRGKTVIVSGLAKIDYLSAKISQIYSIFVLSLVFKQKKLNLKRSRC